MWPILETSRGTRVSLLSPAGGQDSHSELRMRLKAPLWPLKLQILVFMESLISGLAVLCQFFRSFVVSINLHLSFTGPFCSVFSSELLQSVLRENTQWLRLQPGFVCDTLTQQSESLQSSLSCVFPFKLQLITRSLTSVF